MPELDDRLARCFASVFPALPPDQIQAASVESVPAWDSLAAVTLIAVLEEEFNTQIDLMEMPELTSYRAVRDYLQKQIK
ncbi:MAG TPA: acyl carrier protein [Candidatus Acidoferrum sp.]|jgi:acyl carrier protein|nr:acyl carrier protein [Candidatus Acidoferrum sp.]